MKLHYGTNDAVIGGGVHPIAYKWNTFLGFGVDNLAKEKLLDASERQDVINYLATHPKTGVVMEGTAGVRKLRWSRGNQGKSGGVRVIYYLHRFIYTLIHR